MIIAAPKTVAVLDACVLYPPSLRDLLMWLASSRIFAPRWTEAIHDEWIRNVLANNPDVTPAQLERTRRLMNQVAPDCLVSGYELLIPTLSLPDPNDRHVLAAAIEARVDVLVTFNLSDFPAAILQGYGIRPAHPDRFLSSLFDEALSPFLNVVRKHRTSLHNPSKTPQDYIQTLRANRLPETALRVEAHESEI